MKLPITELITGTITLGVVGAIVNSMIKSTNEAEEARAEQERRMNTPCYFNDGISENEFNEMAFRSKKKIKRDFDISVNGPVVSGIVQSLSGISQWCFTVDFNDYGHITGKYWLDSENEDSKLPRRFAEIMSTEIMAYGTMTEQKEVSKEILKRCPYCGKKQKLDDNWHCSYCGRMIKEKI